MLFTLDMVSCLSGQTLLRPVSKLASGSLDLLQLLLHNEHDIINNTHCTTNMMRSNTDAPTHTHMHTHAHTV